MVRTPNPALPTRFPRGRGEPFRIALVQQAVTGSPDENRARGLDAVREAARAGARLVAFAELAFEEFHPRHPATPEALARAEPIPGPTTAPFQEAAAEQGVVVVLNLLERVGERTFDSSPVIDADGRLAGVTRMLHVPDYEGFHERGYYAPGDPWVPVHDTRCGRIGIAICYDRHYPEVMRGLAHTGAELVIVPQAGACDEWPAGIFEAELQVASFQNGYYTALCNRVGREDPLEFAGESFVCDPEGRVIARAARGRDEILLCDIDPRRIRESPAERLFLPDRRRDLFGEAGRSPTPGGGLPVGD